MILWEGIPFFTSWSIKALTVEKLKETHAVEVNKLFMQQTKKKHISNCVFASLYYVTVKYKHTVLRCSFNTSLVFISVWAQPINIKPIHEKNKQTNKIP